MKVSTLCYLRRQNQILFLLRNKKNPDEDINADFYIGLGGKLEEDESVFECVVREVQEEAGVKLLDPNLRGVLTFPVVEDVAAGSAENWVVFLFEAYKWEGTFIESSEGELIWIDEEKLEPLNLLEGDVKMLDMMINTNDLFSLDLYYEGYTLMKSVYKKLGCN